MKLSFKFHFYNVFWNWICLLLFTKNNNKQTNKNFLSSLAKGNTTLLAEEQLKLWKNVCSHNRFPWLYSLFFFHEKSASFLFMLSYKCHYIVGIKINSLVHISVYQTPHTKLFSYIERKVISFRNCNLFVICLQLSGYFQNTA